MIVGNKLIFGYGDIAVCSSVFGQISFQQFKPSGKCGDNVSDDVEYVGEQIIIDIEYVGYCELKGKIKDTEYESKRRFDFNGYSFDFTNYNPESVRVVLYHLDNAIRGYLMCLAC